MKGKKQERKEKEKRLGDLKVFFLLLFGNFTEKELALHYQQDMTHTGLFSKNPGRDKLCLFETVTVTKIS